MSVIKVRDYELVDAAEIAIGASVAKVWPMDLIPKIEDRLRLRRQHYLRIWSSERIGGDAKISEFSSRPLRL